MMSRPKRFESNADYKRWWAEQNKEKVQQHKRDYYERNKEEVRRRSLTYKRESRDLAIEHLGGKCVCCGSTEQLEFNHIDPSQKTLPVGRLMGQRSVLFEELKKCELLCKSCHKKLSMKQTRLAWSVYRLLPTDLRCEWEENPPTSLEELKQQLQEFPL